MAELYQGSTPKLYVHMEYLDGSEAVGVTPTAYWSKDGGAWALAGGSLAEVASGAYNSFGTHTYTPTSSETTADAAAIRVEAPYCKVWRESFQIPPTSQSLANLDGSVSSVITAVGSPLQTDDARLDNVDAPISEVPTAAELIAAMYATAVSMSPTANTFQDALLAMLSLAKGDATRSGTTLVLDKPDGTAYQTWTLDDEANPTERAG